MLGRKKILDDDNEAVSHFIWCVRKRPALYNYKLPPEQRRRVDVARIWQEVANEIGNVSAADCRKKWKNLRDTYHQYRLRKLKYKECLEKWRFTPDLSFLTDIYQPKLKTERARYLHTCSENITTTMNEVQSSDISSPIEHGEESSEDVINHNEVEYMLDSYDDENIEHIVLEDMHLFEAKDGGIQTVSEDSYEEVYLYDETDPNEPVDELTTTVSTSKENIQIKSSRKLHSRATELLDEMLTSAQSSPTPLDETLTIGNKKDELDLFFQFLKTKIQNLPSEEITAIQIEFLNAVQRRETASQGRSANTDT